MHRLTTVISVAALASIVHGLVASPAEAQTRPPRGGTPANYEAGYANGRQMESRPYGVTSQDHNRLIVNGIIQNDAGSYFRSDGADQSPTNSGADYFSSGAGSASSSAIGNLLTVTVNGSWNTVIVDSRQTNSGNISAGGNGAPR